MLTNINIHIENKSNFEAIAKEKLIFKNFQKLEGK